MKLAKQWLLGLVPVAGLLLGAGLSQQATVEADISARGSTALASAGFDWAKISLDGRDATLTGDAPEPGLGASVASLAGQVFGARAVLDKTGLLPEVKPYALTITRKGGDIAITGNVLGTKDRLALIEALAKAAPDAKLDDRRSLARGAPAGFAAAIAFAVPEFAKLGEGALALQDATLSLTGRTRSSANYSEIRARLAALPAGLTLGKGLEAGDILPPLVSPYRFEVERTSGGITLSGAVPDQATRAALLAAATALGRPVTDALQFGDGAPAGDFAGAARLMLAGLGKLQTGKSILEGNAATITGAGMLGVNTDSVRADLASLPAGFRLASVAVEAGVIRPYLFNATRGDGSLSLSGFAPDARARGEITDHARRFFEGERIDDTLVIGPGAPPDFVNSVKAGLQNLSRLLPGASFALSDGAQNLKGMALHDVAREDILTELAARKGQGAAPQAELNTLPLPATVTMPPECQLLFNDILARGRIQFDVGSAELSAVSLGILDRLVVVARRCGEARIEIGGHTDSDGSLEANTELSGRRAEAVARFLVRARIAAERFDVVGYGPARPVADNATPDGKAKNRRIEFNMK